KNFLMDVPGYIRLYTIEGGLERFSTALSEHIQARIELNSPVTRIEKSLDNRYRVWTRREGKQTAHDFDFTIVALPHNWLSFIDWSGEQLAEAMRDHYAFYDHPAHYLRVSLLFHKPFWRGYIKGDYFLLDAFGGCCVYDESARQESGGYGVMDSVDIVTDLALTEIQRRKYQATISASLDFHGTGTGSQPEGRSAKRDQMAALAGRSFGVSGCLNTAYHDFYDGERPYEESF